MVPAAGASVARQAARPVSPRGALGAGPRPAGPAAVRVFLWSEAV